ncbi:MAG: hypothetical protein AAF515_09470 [Pseudomonadota bacterium]
MSDPVTASADTATTPVDTVVLQRYLDGAMDEAELDAFEIALLEDPDLIAAVDAEERLRDVLRDADLQIDETPSAGLADGIAGWLGQRLSQAAVVALGILGYFAFNPGSQSDEGGVRITTANALTLQTFRGAEPEFRTNQADTLLLRVFPVYPEGQAYDVELMTEDGELVEALVDVEIDQQTISLVVPGLAIDHYELRLLARDTTGAQTLEQSYTFAVDPKPDQP